MGWRKLDKKRKAAVICGFVLGVPFLFPGIATIYVHFHAARIGATLPDERAAMRRLGIPLDPQPRAAGTAVPNNKEVAAYLAVYRADEQDKGNDRARYDISDLEWRHLLENVCAGLAPRLEASEFLARQTRREAHVRIALSAVRESEQASPYPLRCSDSLRLMEAAQTSCVLLDGKGAALVFKGHVAEGLGMLIASIRASHAVLRTNDVDLFYWPLDQDADAVRLTLIAIGNHDLDEAASEAASAAIRAIPPLPSLKAALISHFRDGLYRIQNVQSLNGFNYGIGYSAPIGPESAIEHAFLRDEAVRDAFEALYLAAWRPIFGTCLVGEPQTTALISAMPSDEYEDQVGEDFWGDKEQMLNRSVVPERNVAYSYARAIAYRRIATAYLRVLEYRRRHGALPSSLLAAGDNGRDSYDDRPLRYALTGEGFTLYSVGKNGIDEGGTDVALARDHELDVGVRFRLRSPASKRANPKLR